VAKERLSIFNTSVFEAKAGVVCLVISNFLLSSYGSI
jgi:hypothetical protein